MERHGCLAAVATIDIESRRGLVDQRELWELSCLAVVGVVNR